MLPLIEYSSEPTSPSLIPFALGMIFLPLPWFPQKHREPRSSRCRPSSSIKIFTLQNFIIIKNSFPSLFNQLSSIFSLFFLNFFTNFYNQNFNYSKILTFKHNLHFIQHETLLADQQKQSQEQYFS